MEPLGHKDGLPVPAVPVPALACAADPKLNAAQQEGLEPTVDPSCCENSIFTSGQESKAAVPSWGTHLPQDMNRAGEVRVLCQEKPAALGTGEGCV